MSAWHDVLIFHLRNGGFHEQTQTLHSPLPLPVSALPWVDFSGVDLTDTQKVEGPEQGKTAVLCCHSTEAAVEMKTGWGEKEDFTHQGNVAFADTFNFICM